MERRIKPEGSNRFLAAAMKYRYAIAAALLGVLLMLLPVGEGDRRDGAGGADVETASAAAGRAAVQTEMERLLSSFDGVGRLRLMLTTDPDTDRYTGAVVVCEGGGSASVRLQLTQAVSALTGLTSDKIAIVKGRP